MFKIIDEIPLPMLVIIAILMAIMPITGGSHLLQKSQMLMDGTLSKPLDILDLLMHGTPAFLLIIRLLRLIKSDKK